MIITAIDDSPMPHRDALLAALREAFGADRVELVVPRSAMFDLVDVDLPAGITADRVATGWRPISEGGFA